MYALVIAVLSVVPRAPSVSPGPFDKVEHLGAYALLAWCLAHAAKLSAMRRMTGLALSVGASILYGASLEVVQGWLGYRYAEWADVGANALGALIGSAMHRP